jgi:IS5 family transposase
MLKVWLYAYALGVTSARRLERIPGRLQRLQKSGCRQISRSDPESRFLRTRDGWQLGYSAEIAVSQDHLIVAQRVTPNASDHASLLPVVDEAMRQCRGKPQRVSADTGFFSLQNLHGLREREIDGYVPDANLSYELKGKGRAHGIGRSKRLHDPEHRRMRRKLRDPAGRRIYGQRKAIVEPVLGVLKQQRGLRQFRLRGLHRVGIEFTLAANAYNLSRLYHQKRSESVASATTHIQKLKPSLTRLPYTSSQKCEGVLTHTCRGDTRLRLCRPYGA